MADRALPLIRDLQPVQSEVYDNMIQEFVDYVSRFPFVLALYQVGTINEPGISDIDLLVVVNHETNPLGVNQLSVRKRDSGDLQKYLFVHNVYLHNHLTIKNLHYINFFKTLKLLHGSPQQFIDPDSNEHRILALQIIFDFIASRLAQFQSILASGRLPLRTVLLRVSSIKHSALLLGGLGIHDEEIDHFVEKSLSLRRDPNAWNEAVINDLFFESFYYFSRVVELASNFFAEHFLNFYARIDDSVTLKLNSQCTLKFVDQAAEYYRNPKNETLIYYPQEVFYHYLACTRCGSLLSEKAGNHLSYTGGETFDLDAPYRKVLEKRLEAISKHLIFLKKNRAFFAMKGNPGFAVPWESVDTPKEKAQRISALPPSPTSSDAGHRVRHSFEASFYIESLENIKECTGLKVERWDFKEATYEKWTRQYVPDWKERYGHLYHKKLVELFVTFQILDPGELDSYMDAAGGRNTYIDKLPCRDKYMQGIANIEPLMDALGPEIQFLEGDAADILLPDSSLSKISCHHSFEHFQGDSDSAFIHQVQRLLKPGGTCCIIPLFVADRYIEVTRTDRPHCHFDDRSLYITDPCARITGGDTCGDYARIYDIPAFQERVIGPLDQTLFNITLSEISIDGRPVPDMALPCHRGISKANLPYRAMTIVKNPPYSTNA